MYSSSIDSWPENVFFAKLFILYQAFLKCNSGTFLEAEGLLFLKTVSEMSVWNGVVESDLCLPWSVEKIRLELFG